MVATTDLKGTLKQFFGFDNFKGTQEKVIKSLLDGNDTFVIMPTGGGKSLCYQLPAVVLDGTAIVVSPLIALMKNQVDLFRSYSSLENIAHFLNSSLTKTQQKKVKADLMTGRTKILYVAPETLAKKENLDFFRDIKISFVAVDEAHCISEWGHDFRPEYRQIRSMIDEIDEKIPVMALTATATPKVQSDIIKNMRMRDPQVFISSFNRPNLYYEVKPKGDKTAVLKDIIGFIKKNSGKSGIIYCLSRKSTEELAKNLLVNGIKASPYHAGLDADVRSTTQDDFLMERIDVICATIAFGMGIDKPDIRFVIHFNIPKSIENYYQETGRGGRDGMEGKCITYFSYKDLAKLEKFLRDKPVAERELGQLLIQETSAYAETGVCRRKFLLNYFGEKYKQADCGKCDNCINPKEQQEGKDYLKSVIKAVMETEENHEISHIVNVLLGKKSQDVRDYGHDKVSMFGIGKGHDEHFWNSMVRQALLNSLLRSEIEQYGVLKVTPEGSKFLKKAHSIMVTLNHQYVTSEEDDEEIEIATSSEGTVLDPGLMKLLKDLRNQIARQHKLPPYIIFDETSLEEMATRFPLTLEELTNMSGVGKGKAVKYGKPFLEAIQEYVEENDIDRPMDFTLKSIVNKSGSKIFIIQNIDRKLSLEEIAQSKRIKMDELLEEIETIVSSGTRVNLDYYINDILDEEQREEIFTYFRKQQDFNLRKAHAELQEGGYTETEIRLMHIKFMSELAN